MSLTIETTRLRLLSFSPQHLLALVESVAQFDEQFGVRAADGLRAFLVSDDVPREYLEGLRAATVADPWVHGFAVVERAANLVVGNAAFKGPPDEGGVVEIAYAIVPRFEGRGYATEAAKALVEHARTDGRVRGVRAHTLPLENASTRVLTKCGFQRTGEIEDPHDGPIWRWELAT